MSVYVSVDSVKSMYNVESMEDVTIAYYVFFNYSYTEIVEIYEDEIRFKEELLDKYKNCKIQSEFTETKMKEIIRILGQYINNNNDPVVETIYYRLCKFYYK